ncbi:hypothetical protein PoB_002397400 [Plakobranchus ocellatus]|uniref:Uncharacterized protein n=1 Tax=Plakobranchus ocellatus TaxID=259542 RepID=A0AAV3ZQ62_9GAST|nr:hypothetical protein PoB_002397400 [Plakobranchus ocellatus]
MDRIRVQGMYSPSRQVYINLEGPKPCKEHQTRLLKLQAQHCFGETEKSSESSQNNDISCSSAKETTHRPRMPLRKKKKTDKMSPYRDAESAEWVERWPFNLSQGQRSITGNLACNKITATGLNNGRGVDNSNRGQSMSDILVSRLRLRQLIEMADFAMVPDKDDKTPKVKKKLAMKPTATTTGETISRKEQQSLSVSSHLVPVNRCHDALNTASFQHSSEDNDMCSGCETETTPSTNARVKNLDKTRGRWACRRAISAGASLHMCQIKAQPSAGAGEQDATQEQQTKVPDKSPNVQHSSLWDSVLRRRNSAHQDVSRSKHNNAMEKARIRQQDFQNRKLVLGSHNLKDSLWSASDNGHSKAIDCVTRGGDRFEKGRPKNYINRLLKGDSHPEKKEDNFRSSLSMDCKVLQVNHTMKQTGEDPLPGKKFPLQDCPPEVFFPPYSRVRKEAEGKRGRAKSAHSDLKHQNRKPNHSMSCRTASGLWHSLAYEDKAKDKTEENFGDQVEKNDAKTLEEENVTLNNTLSLRGRFDDVFMSDGSAEKQDPSEIAPTEVIRLCQAKGYEILRKLTRGKLRENISLYLASNEGTPKYSPVEVTVVTLPSRSFARSFVEASFTDNTASRRRQGFARRGTSLQLMSAHKNLV